MGVSGEQKSASQAIFWKNKFENMNKKYKILCENNNLIQKNNFINQNYKWEDLYKCKAMLHLPYEISTMSIFEQYSANIPLIFPSKVFLKKLLLLQLFSEC